LPEYTYSVEKIAGDTHWVVDAWMGAKPWLRSVRKLILLI